MQEGDEDWCAFHGPKRAIHRAKGYCTVVLENGAWCRNVGTSEGQCPVCIAAHAERVRAARARVEAEAERQRAHQVKCETEAEEDALMREQPWFPALERYLDEREQTLQHKMEEWANDQFEHDNTPDYDCS